MATNAQETSQKQKKDKILRDPIHGSIELNGALMKIIDTPQFQRLRRIKQCGATFVYPGAVHTRFEHSIGVCHIAGELMKGLRKLHEKDKQLPTLRDAFCVQIAALCHDLGHGPFSHLYDECLKDKHGSSGEQDNDKMMHHEHRSAAILEKLMDDCEFWDSFENKNLPEPLKKDPDLKLIQTMITIAKDTEKLKEQSPKISYMKEKLKEAGRDESKIYLLEIVANGLTGIDVDKMDYFARDSHGLGLPNRFDWRRYIQVARVNEVKSPETCYRLCTNKKEIDNLYEMFHTRAILHTIAFHHKTTRIVQHMFEEAFRKAGFVKVYRQGETRGKSILKCYDDMEMFHLLDDSIVDIILKTVHPHEEPKASDPTEAELPCIRVYKHADLPEVRETLRRIVENRKLPVCIGSIMGDKITQLKLNLEEGKSTIPVGDKVIPCIWQEVKVNYGMKENNPLKQHYVYSKHDPETSFPITDSEVSKLLVPKEFHEEYFFLYYDTHEYPESNVEALKNWLEEKNKADAMSDAEQQNKEAGGNAEQ